MLPVVALVVLAALAAGILAAIDRPSESGAPLVVQVSVGRQVVGRPIPPGFLGLSLEYPALEAYAGSDPAAPDPVFLTLVRNLAPGGRPVLRIGGDSADSTWWPVAGMARPPGVSYALDERWLAVARGLVARLRARLLLGLNLEADSATLAATEDGELQRGLPSRSIIAFELGNEPSLYGTFAWYRTASGRGVPGRPRSYGFDAFLSDFRRVAATLPAGVPLAGPTTGGFGWFADLGRFLDAEPAVRLVTVHRYPLQLCLTGRRSPRYPTIAHLLAPAASVGLARAFAGPIALAHARGLPLRIDELNTVSCGAAPAVSQTFAAALWAPEALFALARAGVEGVNVHTFPGAGYALFAIRHGAAGWSATVAPEYYGLLMFAQAAPAGSRLLSTTVSGGDGVQAWATRGVDSRTRVLLVDSRAPAADGSSGPDTVRVRIGGAAGATATVERLLAGSLSARSGVSLGGESFGSATASGELSGRRSTETVRPSAGVLTVSVAPGSAALMTVAP